MQDAIRFYATTGPWGCFSNFSPHEFCIAGARYKTVEHYFQAAKFVDTDDRWPISILKAKTPKLAAEMGRSREHRIAPAWDSQKNDVMYRALIAKFSQNRDCLVTLLSTGTATIIESSQKDYYWGEGGDGSGKNMLGKLLMKLRAEMIDELMKVYDY